MVLLLYSYGELLAGSNALKLDQLPQLPLNP